MTVQTCIVYQTLLGLSEFIASGRLTHPRARRRAEDLLDLIRDVSTGAGGPQHLQAMLTSVATIVLEEPEAFSTEIVRLVGKPLETHREVFASHIDTHNCPTGQCDILTPAPCQMA